MGVDVILAAKTKQKRTDDELRELNYRFMEASNLGYEKNPIGEADFSRYYPDSDTYYYEVHTLSRYYGEDYARGHWPEIYAGIEWLRQNFPEAEIVYGGDHTSIENIGVLTKEEQEEIMRFWCKQGGLSYRTRPPESPLFRRECPNCKIVMSQSMWSGGNGRITCQGCKFQEETTDQGKTWFEVKKPV